MKSGVKIEIKGKLTFVLQHGSTKQLWRAEYLQTN